VESQIAIIVNRNLEEETEHTNRETKLKKRKLNFDISFTKIEIYIIISKKKAF